MKKVVLLLMAVLTFTSCIDEATRHNPKVFEVTPETSQISALAQNLVFNLNCDKEWTASLSSGTWARISDSDPETGRIVVSASINETPADRSDILTITSGTLSLKVPITQQGINSILSSTDIVLERVNPQIITIHANAVWTASKIGTLDSRWLTMEPSHGSAGDCDIVFKATEDNVNIGDRNLMIKFEMGENVFYATVTQKQTDAIIKSRDKFELSNGEQSITIDLQTNVNYDVICPNWISRTTTKALNSASETFLVSANPDQEPREGEIVFKGGDVNETVHVYQAECDVLVFGQTDFVVPSEGGVYDLELRSNVEYDITWPDVDWLRKTEAEIGPRPASVRVDALSITVDPSYKLQPREAVIVVKDKNSEMTSEIIVRQEGNDPEFQDEDDYGVYDIDGTQLYAYIPKQCQTSVMTKNGIKSFRILNIQKGTFASFEGFPEKAGLADTFDITLKHNLSIGLTSGKSWPVTVFKVQGDKLWLYNDEGFGFIIKK